MPEHFNIPLRKSIDEGVFSTHNIELNWMDFKGGTGDLVQALNAKILDIGILLTEGAVKAVAMDSPMKIIQIYVNTPLVWGVYAGSKSKFNTLDDVKNPIFLISRFGSGSHLMAYYLAKQRGWNMDEIEFIEVGNFSGALRAFNQDPNCLFMWERFMTKPSVDSGMLKKLSEVPTPWPSFCIVVRNDLIDSNREVLIEILRIISNYTYKFKQNTLQSIDYISSYFDFSVADMKEWIQTTDWNYVIDIPNPKVEKAVQFLREVELIPENVQTKDVCVDSHFWDGVDFSS